MTSNGHLVRLQFCSAFDMLDFVQLVSDHLCRRVGFDEDSMHWVGVAVRESVINAIKHGNQHDQSKMVHVDFRSTDQPDGELVISVCDEGEGSSPRKSRIPLRPRTCSSRAGEASFSCAASWTTWPCGNVQKA